MRIKSIITGMLVVALNINTYSFTMGGVKDSSGMATIGDGSAEVWMSTPAYVYRNYGEEVKNVTVASGVKLFTLRHRKTSPRDGYNIARVVYDLGDNLSGKYRIENVKITKQRNTSGVSVKSSSNGFIVVEDFLAESASYDAEVEVSGDIIYSAGEEEGKGITYLNCGVSYVGSGDRANKRISKPFEFSTYTDVKIQDVSFGAVIPQLGVKYERYSSIDILGGREREVVANLTSDGGRGQEINSTLKRSGGQESIPIKYELVNTSNALIENGVIPLNSQGRGEAKLKAIIDSMKIPTAQKSGVYNGIVRIDVRYN